MSRGNNKAKLTLFINTFNEEKNIKKCLENLKWINNIIIVDSYSTDQTIQIASKFTKKIYFKKFNNFEDQRNFTLNKINSEWVLFMDADEILSPNANELIPKLINNETADGFWFRRKQFINSKYFLKSGYFYPDWQLRLFKKNKDYKFNGIIHALINIPIYKTRKINQIEIIHNSSKSKYSSFFSFIRFTDYIKKEGEELALTGITNKNLLKNMIIEPFRHFIRSFIRKKGYIDGFFGFVAAFNFGLYQGGINFYALYLRLIKII